MDREHAKQGTLGSPRPGEKPVEPMVSHWEQPQILGAESPQDIAQSAPDASVPGISVVVPLWNEELNVAPLVQRVFQALRNETLPVELILVDDASDDTTWKRILEAQREEPRLRPIRLLRHSGQSAALWAGFSASRGGIIATLDGDLQNDPADLPLLLKELSKHDLVCGVRTKRMDNIVRRISSSIARWARKIALGVDFRDTGCNLRAFKRSVLKKLFPFNGLHRFMPVLAQCTGHSVLEIPVSHHPRTAGKSKYGVWNRLGRGIWDLVAISWYTRRQLADIPAVEHIQERPPRTEAAMKPGAKS